MTISMDDCPELVLPAARAIRSAIDLGDGGTEKQRHLLEFLLADLWGRPDLGIDVLDPITPDEVATSFETPVVRRRLQRFLVLFEFCRHPFSAEQVALIDRYHDALGDSTADGIDIARDFVTAGYERADANIQRRSAESVEHLAEVSLAARYAEVDQQAPELAALLRGFAELPPGTLGREYVDFYMNHAFELPGEGHGSPAFFVRHDMMHVLAGYGPTSPEEVALAAFQYGMHDTDDNWNFFVVAMAALELGMLTSENFDGKFDILDRDGAMELMVEGFARGAQCHGDLAEMDHIAEAHVPVEELRERFTIPTRTA